MSLEETHVLKPPPFTFHDEFEVEIKTNFIPAEELKEYVKEQDTSIAAVLFEYLLLAEA
jgi:hypothetical protein